jgi:hypothetical protein
VKLPRTDEILKKFLKMSIKRKAAWLNLSFTHKVGWHIFKEMKIETVV